MLASLAAAAAFCLALAAERPGESCSTCHEEVVKAFPATRHAARSCESCHGSSAKHVDSAKSKDIVRQSDQNCLTCHRNGASHAGRIAGGHARNQVACASCHAVHEPPRPKAIAAQNAQCAGCHVSAFAEFAKPHGHRVREGAVSCVDCHNPHGRPLATPVRLQVNEPGCLACHGDKRGPFAFEHAPVKLSSCTTCHEPHGSANPRMLIRHEVRLVCLECHLNIGAKQQVLGTVPPAFHDLLSARYRNCTVCHVRIHGSHADRAFLR